MKKDWFWRTMAVCGLLIVGVYVGMLLRDRTPFYGSVQAGGGADNGIIAMTADNGAAQQRLYLVDPQAKTILVYESRTGGGSFSLACGRFFGHEAELATLEDLPWNSRGYSVQEVMARLKQVRAANKR